MSYAAFCRNGGNHSTAAVGYRNWNKEAMHVMVIDLEDPCEDLRNDFQNQQLEASKMINNSWEDAISLLS